MSTFCSTLPSSFSRERSEKPPATQPTNLTSISKLRQKLSIGPDAREISGRSGLSYSQDDRYYWFIVLFYYYPAVHFAVTLILLRFTLPATWRSPDRSRVLIRTLIGDDLSELDRSVDGRARPVIVPSHGLHLLLETINLMGIYRRAKILWAVVHPCQTVINVSKDRYLLSKPECLSFSRAPACRLLPSGDSLLFTLLRVRGEGSRCPFLSCSLYSPPFYRGIIPSIFLLFCPFVTRGCLDRLPFSSLLASASRSHPPFFHPLSDPLYAFPDNATKSGEGCVSWIYHATRFSLDRNKRVRRVADARVSRCFSARRHGAVSCDA